MSSARSGAAARAAALTARARALGAAQAEVHARTMGEITALSRAAVRFFDALPLPEFSGTLLPASARSARRLRHKVLHQAMVADESGATLRALLLGRDACLRMFSARSSVARDFISAVEPGQSPLGAGINRDVADWSPRMRLPEFRAADVLEKLSGALDEVESRLAAAERRVAAQRRALASGDLGAIRDSLGASPEPPPAIAAGSLRPDAARLTPAPGTRAIRPPAPTPELERPAARPALPAGAAPLGPEAPPTAPVTPSPAAPAPVAAASAAAPGDVTTPKRPASAEGGPTTPAPAGVGALGVRASMSDPAADGVLPAPRAASVTGTGVARVGGPEGPPAPAPAPAVPASAPDPIAAQPVQGAPSSGASWLSRAMRAAMRTPAVSPLVSDSRPAAPDGAPGGG